MFFTSLLLLPLCLPAVFSAPVVSRDAIISDQTIFTPPADYTQPGTRYARTALLPDGTILATWENYSPDMNSVYFPIYSSHDDGATWAQIGQVNDQVNGWGMRYGPSLYVLPEAIGAFAKGTVVCAGISTDKEISKNYLELYASTDGGKTWIFASHVAMAPGGPGGPGLANKQVWEPFVMSFDNQIIVYYSDQRDPNHFQQVVHQSSTDGINWAPPVIDIAYPELALAPGMPSIAKLPNDQYIMVYEYGFGVPNYAIHYRIAADPTSFSAAPDQMVIGTNGKIPESSPSIVWTSFGGPDGTLVLTFLSQESVYTNTALGAADQWIEVPTPQQKAYARSLLVLSNPQKIMICGAGLLAPNTDNSMGTTTPQNLGNHVSLSVINL